MYRRLHPQKTLARECNERRWRHHAGLQIVQKLAHFSSLNHRFDLQMIRLIVSHRRSPYSMLYEARVVRFSSYALRYVKCV
jgi:hypothetical protein